MSVNVLIHDADITGSLSDFS